MDGARKMAKTITRITPGLAVKSERLSMVGGSSAKIERNDWMAESREQKRDSGE